MMIFLFALVVITWSRQRIKKAETALTESALELIKCIRLSVETQFTAEGLILAWTTTRHCGGAPAFTAGLSISYRCRSHTQDECPSFSQTDKRDFCRLMAIKQLHRRRAPGNTCLSALREGLMPVNGNINNSSIQFNCSDTVKGV